jgi:hypothetical protein
MTYYEKIINSFLSSVSSNMSAVYLPAFLVSLINLLEDYFKFDQIQSQDYIEQGRSMLHLSLRLTTAYFLFYLIQIRKSIPDVRMTPVRGKSHEERFLDRLVDINRLSNPLDLISTPEYTSRLDRITAQMLDKQNIYPVFERRCPIFRLSKDGIDIDMAAIETLLQNSILYTKMAELLCFQYLTRLSGNLHLTSHLENYFIRGGSREDFGNTARSYVYKYQDYHCFYCNRPMDESNAAAKPRADHFVPWVFVKSSRVENLVFACNECNSDKLDRLPAISFFNRLLKRNDPGSDFWKNYPDSIPNLDERVERWVKHYYLAGEQLSTGWRPSGNTHLGRFI